MTVMAAGASRRFCSKPDAVTTVCPRSSASCDCCATAEQATEAMVTANSVFLNCGCEVLAKGRLLRDMLLSPKVRNDLSSWLYFLCCNRAGRAETAPHGFRRSTQMIYIAICE